MMLRILALLMVIPFGLTACGTTPQSDYYMLSANAEKMPEDGGPSLGIGPISIPEYLARKAMVLNRDRHKLSVNEYHRWAEPLDAGINRVVALNLASLLDTHEVQSYPWRRDHRPDFGVAIDIIQFAVHDQEADLIAEWTITDPTSGRALKTKLSRFTTNLADGQPELVAAAYSELLLELSDDIAEEITRQLNT